jgi:hypothetical protein
MTDGVRPGWRSWLPRVGPRERRDKFWAGREAFEITVGQARERRTRALECNLFVVVPDHDIMLVGADDQDAGPDAPPFADFLRVVRDEGPADFQYIWMIELIPDDPPRRPRDHGVQASSGDFPVQFSGSPVRPDPGAD